MLADVAPLWIIGLACLVAAAVGGSVKLGGSEIPAISSPASRGVVAIVGVVALVLGLTAFLHDSSASGSSNGSASPSGAPPSPLPSHSTDPSPSPSPSPPPSPSPSPPPTTTPTPPPTTPTVAPSRVRWHGTLVLGGYGGTGGGWWLDPVPPTQSPVGDLSYGDPQEVVGNTLVGWDGPGAPGQQQCSDALNTHLGQHVVDARAGAMGCFRTWDGRVGYFTVVGEPGTDRENVEVTVWEKT